MSGNSRCVAVCTGNDAPALRDMGSTPGGDNVEVFQPRRGPGR